MPAEIDLKPCPFCGSHRIELGGNYVECKECGGSSYCENDDHHGTEAVRRWNTRAALAVPDQCAVNQALEAAAIQLEVMARRIRGKKVER